MSMASSTLGQMHNKLFPSPSKAFAILTIFIALFSCRRDPEWLSATEKLLDKATRNLDTISPFLAPGASPQDVLIGLNRLEKAIDETAADTLQLWKKYPEMRVQQNLITSRLDSKMKNLSKKMGETAANVKFWNEKLKRKEIYDIVVRISKKMYQIDRQTLPD